MRPRAFVPPSLDDSEVLKALTRPLLIIMAFITGGCFSGLGQLQLLLRFLLIGMLYFVFLKLEFRSLAPKASHFWLLLTNLLLPVLCWLPFHLAGERDLAAAAFFTAITPTATAAPVVMRFLKGDVNFVITSFIVTNLFCSIAMFLLIPMLITGNVALSGFAASGVMLLILVGIPLCAALLSRKVYPESIAWADKFGNVTFIMWVIMLCIISGKAADFIRQNHHISWWMIAAAGGISLLICIFNFGIGFLLGGKRYARECSQSLGQKNTTLTIVLAVSFASPLAAMGPTFYVLWHNLCNAMQLYRHEKMEQTRKADCG